MNNSKLILVLHMQRISIKIHLC